MVHTPLLILSPAVVGRIHAFPIPVPPLLNTSSSAEGSSPFSACIDINHCRSRWSIIYSCVATIFACTYFSFHPNLPNRTHSLWRARVTHACAVLFGFFFLDVLVVSAALQWRDVQNKKPNIQGASEICVVSRRQPSIRSKGWTRTHSYFKLMGGFDGWARSLDGLSLEFAKPRPEMLAAATVPCEKTSKSSRVCSLPCRMAWPCLTRDTSSPEFIPPEFRILVSEEEILDKSKSDPLGKLFAIVQTTWFIAQYSQRWFAHQLRTQLEVMTLAYAILNILVYTLWWGKPQNIQEPINVGHRASATVDVCGEEAPLLVRDALKLYIEDEGAAIDDGFTYVIFLSVGILFGGVHCFAWRFPFLNDQEKLLWRICAVYCTAFPLLYAASYFIPAASNNRCPQWVNRALKAVVDMPRDLLFDGNLTAGNIFAALPLIIYIVCRVILVVLTLTSLHAPPAGIYEATAWTSFLPHFG